ncbi:N-acetylmuramoyl-L-alanine amidase domain protein [Synechococcus sp. PCC 7335]|uniref:N-acetylmuramoyl-L-alanine amidase n=1 Tax=Synechococcus sp. (strain ATCC 29403 / PCC 7335) TaxID=91464 RepID=UPI00017EE752|nr:N-acetylmuramoyl-L-alanine amidase [Synechococcus sp. PCC 7335]EDX84511.1 N-acetylmuramoyl-L-alanine amidase domain protein [Synechococcus sp. PCC 7335]
MKSIIRRTTTLTALMATVLGASAITSTRAIAQDFGEQPIAVGQAVAIAEPVSNGRFYRLLILEQLSDSRACYAEKSGSPTVIEPLLLNFTFSGICGRSSDSNSYSVRIGNEDLSLQYRLQIIRRGNSLVLMALPGALPGRGGDLPALEIGRSDGVANDFVKIELASGWKLTSRTLNGQDQDHIYLSNAQDLGTVVAQARTSNPSPPFISTSPAPATPSPPGPPILSNSSLGENGPSASENGSKAGPPILSGESLPAPSENILAAAPRGSNTYYQVIVPSSSALVRLRVRQVANDAFTTTVNGNRVIQAGVFQERSRADQLVAELSSKGLASRIVEGRRGASATPSSARSSSARSSSPTPSSSSSSARFYQVVVLERNSNTRARVNAVEPGAFRTQIGGRRVIQAGRFRDRNRAEQLQRRLSAARLSARIIEGSAPVASSPQPATRPSTNTPSANIPRARQGQLTVVIDPGHGGRDPGAVGIGGLREKDINIAVARRMQVSLQEKGINVVMTRSDDREIDLQPRVNLAERTNADIFVSIHSNAISLSRPEVNGLETYYYSSGLRLAQTIHNSVLQRTNLRDRGVRRARFYVLVNTSMPAVLVETGFVTGREDAARFRDPQAVNEIADGITAGVLQYLNVR